MSKPAEPALPFYVTDYLRDTGHLSPCEHGSYMLLLMQAWTREGVLPEDDRQLRALARMDPKDWKRSRATVMAFFFRVDGGYRHKRIDAELDNTRANSEQRRAAGLASAAARARQRDVNGDPNGGLNGGPNDVGNGTGNGVATRVDSVPSSIKEESKEESKQASKPRASPLLGLESVVPDPKTGRPVCNGRYLDVVQERVFDAARIDDTKWRGNIRPLIQWLIDDIDTDDIVAAIERCSQRPGYEVPSSLNYFKSAVMEQHGRRPRPVNGFG